MCCTPWVVPSGNRLYGRMDTVAMARTRTLPKTGLSAEGRRHPVPCPPSARQYWRLVEENPVHAERMHRFGELLEIDGLSDVAIDTQAITLDDISLFAR